MADDKRCDIKTIDGKLRIPVEIKRHFNAGIWTAIKGQLAALYAADYAAQGFGVYVVFWFGLDCGGKIPNPPAGITSPKTAEEFKIALENTIPNIEKHRLKVVVIDVARRT